MSERTIRDCDETPAERVEAIPAELHMEVLVRIVEIVDAHRGGGGWLTISSKEACAMGVVDALRDWSLID